MCLTRLGFSLHFNHTQSGWIMLLCVSVIREIFGHNNRLRSQSYFHLDQTSTVVHANITPTSTGLSSAITNELVEFEKLPVQVQNFKKHTNHFEGVYKIQPSPIKKNRKMSTCNQLGLETLGCHPRSALFKYCNYTRACTKGVLFRTSMYKMYGLQTYCY